MQSLSIWKEVAPCRRLYLQLRSHLPVVCRLGLQRPLPQSPDLWDKHAHLARCEPFNKTAIRHDRNMCHLEQSCAVMSTALDQPRLQRDLINQSPVIFSAS